MTKARLVLERLPTSKRDAAGCLIVAGDRVLLLQRSADSYPEPLKWGIPGGRLESGETPWQAAIRETLEESGVELSQYSYHTYLEQLTPHEGVVFTTFVYYFKPSFITLNPVTIDHESEDWGWFTREETDSLDLHLGVVELFNRINF